MTLSVLDVNEDEASVTFVATLNNPTQTAMTITTTQGVIAIAAGASTGKLVVNTQDSDVYIDPDSITATITGTSGGNFEAVDYLTNGTATAQISDTIDTTTLILDDVTVEEGVDTATIVGHLDNAPLTYPLVVTLDNGAVLTFAVDAVEATSTEFTVEEGVYSYTVAVVSTSNDTSVNGHFEDLNTDDTADVYVPLDHAISNVVYYLVGADDVVMEVKLDDWDGEIKDASYPEDLYADVLAAVGEVTDGTWEIVGYTIKAGQDYITIGTIPAGADTDQSTTDLSFSFDVSTGTIHTDGVSLSNNDETIDLRGMQTTGSEGDDTFVANRETDVDLRKGGNVDGGEGEDTLVLDFDGTVDLGELNLQNFEIIELSGEIELNIEASDVISVTDDNNTLIISGDSDESGASVNISSDWVETGNTADYVEYEAVYNGYDAILQIDAEIVVDIV